MDISPQQLVDQIREQLLKNRPAAVDLVYKTLDPLLLAGRFEEVKAYLKVLAENDLPRCIILSAIIVTSPWHESLGTARTNLLMIS